MEKPSSIKKLNDTLDLWDVFSATADFKSDEYDEELLSIIKKDLNLNPKSDIRDIREELDAKNISSEELLSVLLRSLRPFSIMLSDLLGMFEAAGAKSTDDNIQIKFDFKDAKDNFGLDLNHFRAYTTKTKQVVRRELLLDSCNPWRDFVTPINGITNNIFYQINDTRGPIAHIRAWIDECYKDYKRSQNWPDWFPLPPKSGNKTIDSLISEIWEIPKASNDLYRLCYSSSLGRIESLRRKEDIRQSFFYVSEIDMWLRTYIELVCSIAYVVKYLSEEGKESEIREIENKLTSFRGGLPICCCNYTEQINELLDILELPIWKKRYAWYSAWVATQIVSASDKWKVEYQVIDNCLSFSFGGSVIAHLLYHSNDIVLRAELRTLYTGVKSKKRKSHIQPDYSLCIGDETDPRNTVLVVECKQYKKPNKKNFTQAVIDYAGGRPNAKVILVNYMKIPETFRGRLDKDISARVPYFDILSPSGEGRDLFKSAVRSALIKDCTVNLTWERAPRDLDLYLVITAPEGKKTIVSYSDRGCLDQFPFAKLDDDKRSGWGTETIHFQFLPGYHYDIYIHNYSGEETDGEIRVSANQGKTKLFEAVRSTDIDKANLWYVFSSDGFSFHEKNRTIPFVLEHFDASY